MNEKIVEAILKLTDEAKAKCQQPEGVLKLTQSALNLAHAGSMLMGVEIQEWEFEKKKKAGAK